MGASRAGEGRYRLCWTVFRSGRDVEYGTLTGRDVPGMLRGLRGCLPTLPGLDPARVRAAADTADGWSYESDTADVHTHRIPEQSAWATLFGCPGQREGRW
ncbi:MAG TPA: hypothetical protein VF054_11320 [Micromonosporaceae bacterium]